MSRADACREGRAAARAGTVKLAQAYLARDTKVASLAMAEFVEAAPTFFERADAGPVPCPGP